MQATELKTLLESGLESCDVQVEGEGNSFNLTVVGDVFEGLSLVKKQQTVYAVLNDLIADGTIHAVTMKTYTKPEWEKASKFQSL